MSSREYKIIVEERWKDLLERSQTQERDFQEFIERHPSIMPNNLFLGGHHHPFPLALVSQPRLTGISSRIPDFMLIVRDSACVTVILYEIEDPGKTWYTNGDQPTADLTQAMNQLIEWKNWFQDPINVLGFKSTYRIPDWYLANRAFRQRYVLIYGRQNDPSLIRNNPKRALLEQPDIHLMTYDRLGFNSYFNDLMTVRFDGEYIAKYVQPTLRWGPVQSMYYHIIKGKEDAIKMNPDIPEERKKFLISRSKYWDNYGSKGRPSIITHPSTE